MMEQRTEEWFAARLDSELVTVYSRSVNRHRKSPC